MKFLFKLLPTLFLLAVASAEQSQLRFCLRSDPKTFDPLLVDEESGETVRYLTSGVLIRVNRVTQQAEPELAEKMRFDKGGLILRFELRKGVRFSDGTPFTSDDVVFTFRRLLDPSTHSPLADGFKTAKGLPQVSAENALTVRMVLPSPIVGIERLLDQVPILSAHSAKKEKAVLGPFELDEYKPGSAVILKRNPHYWKRDPSGRQLPLIDSIRLDIQSNRDIEAMRFRKGELDLITGLDPELFDQLKQDKRSVLDIGPSFDSEMIWFNQTASSPLPDYKKLWFRSQAFRKAISRALNRDDIARLVYRGHAQPSAGPYSSANKLFGNSRILPEVHSSAKALESLAADGFQKRNDGLYDRSGRRVKFSLITNAGNKSRARIAALLQQDLAKIGIEINIVALDFPSLIERITKTFDYDACLLGLINVDPDPNGQMNVWLSSGANHQWNPRQKAPETPWEAEIDRLMLAQSSTMHLKSRQASFRRVQEIIAEQVPFIYLVSRNSLVAFNADLGGITPSALRPELLWNVENLYLKPGRKR